MYALRRRPISGKRYPPTSLPKLGLRTTLDMERDVEERALEDDDGAKADADASKRKERAPVSFMLLIRRRSIV